MIDDDFKHCDDYIDDETQPECLRAFLDYARSPAHGSLRPGKSPCLFADYRGDRVRVVMASRFGDVGITSKLHAEHGYDRRVDVASLSNFGTRRKRDSDQSPKGRAAQRLDAKRAGAVAKPIAQTAPGNPHDR